MSPLELQKVLSSGLLSFPITDFQANGDFDAPSYAKRLQWLAPYRATALFARAARAARAPRGSVTRVSSARISTSFDGCGTRATITCHESSRRQASTSP